MPPQNRGFGTFGHPYMRPPPFNGQYLNHYGPSHYSPSPKMYNYRNDYNYQSRFDTYDNNMFNPTQENRKYYQQQNSDGNNVVLRARPKQVNEEKERG